MIKLKLSSQLIGQFGHVTASASCKQPEKHSNGISPAAKLDDHVFLDRVFFFVDYLSLGYI